MPFHRFLSIPLLSAAIAVQAQTPAKQPPDTLVLNDGEKLVGRFVRSTGDSLRFKSDAFGEVTIHWSKVSELHTSGEYAVIPKTVILGRHPDTSAVPQGAFSEADQKIEVTPPGGTRILPLEGVTAVLDVPTFNKEVKGHPDFWRDWHGTATLGASLVQATQDSRTITSAVALVRTIPAEDWMSRRDRTTLNFTSSYGVVTQPNTPKVKTSIFHGDAERDEYFSPAVFAFAQTLFDHNYSQGLDLQQTYVGGLGWSALKRTNETLDLKGGFSFIRQQFSDATAAKNLASSVFDEKYLRRFFHGSTFTEELSVSPAWTEARALSALGSATLALPVYRHFSFSTGVADAFLNDPPAGFRKNSVQFTTGITYVLP